MNERIKQLLLKAGWDRYEALDERNQKFAELIVRECVCLVLNGKYDEEKFRADDEFHCGHNTALDFTAEGLKLHFGVE